MNNLYFVDGKDYKFIEIGTSDFNTEIEKVDDDSYGISVEPIDFYLNKLPEKQNVIKLNAAVSNFNGHLPVYYIPEQIMYNYHLPFWVRGCSCVSNPHPQVVKLLEQFGIPLSIIQSKKITCMRLETLYEFYKVNKCKLLKIDAEGHDCVILKDAYNFLSNRDKEFRPDEIIFETNELTDLESRNEIINLYENIGYKFMVLDPKYGSDGRLVKI